MFMGGLSILILQDSNKPPIFVLDTPPTVPKICKWNDTVATTTLHKMNEIIRLTAYQPSLGAFDT
jgi:hypothetical protein